MLHSTFQTYNSFADSVQNCRYNLDNISCVNNLPNLDRTYDSQSGNFLHFGSTDNALFMLSGNDIFITLKN